jgi:8-amino-7-oxononanoate synthase
MQLPENLFNDLEKRKTEHSLRQLSNQQFEIDFYSNDYLGYAKNQDIGNYGTSVLQPSQFNAHGSTGSRLISGNHSWFQKVEDKAKAMFKAQAALYFNSGYDANIGLLSAILKPKDIIFFDELCHASIRDGLQMSPTKAYKFKHNDYEDLAQKIKSQHQRLEPQNTYIITESVFSMDGDMSDIGELVTLAKANNAFLIVDEAHAVGVCGTDYKGLTFDYAEHIFARIITCGKSLGSHGALFLGSEDLKLFLVNFSRPFIYSTAASPAHIQQVLSALLYFENDLKAKQQLQHRIDYFRHQVQQHGLSAHFLESTTAIQSYIIEDNVKAKALAKALNEKGIGIKAILHPTVPKGKERLRICLHSYNTENDIDFLLKILTQQL